MNPFIEPFLVSQAAGHLYDELFSGFPGGGVVPTPITDPLHIDAEGLSKWWRGRYDELKDAMTPEIEKVLAQMGASPWERDMAERAAKQFVGVLDQLSGARERPEGVGTSELCEQLARKVKDLARFLPDLDVLARVAEADRNSDLTKAVTDFADGMRSVVLGTVALAEYDERSAERVFPTRSEIFNEVRVRDVCGRLHGMTGDLPESLLYAGVDTPEDYLDFATEDMTIGVVVDRFDPDERARVERAELYLQEFKRQLQSAKLKGLSADALVEMATMHEQLAVDTRERVLDRDEQNAHLYVELAAVFAETMRGVLGLKPRGEAHSVVRSGPEGESPSEMRGRAARDREEFAHERTPELRREYEEPRRREETHPRERV
jgi:hypothetical protein